MSNSYQLDETDHKILWRLMREGRITWSELGGYLGLSAPAAADRVRRLEEKGVIKGYAAQVDAEVICGVAAFVSVTLDHPDSREAFLQIVHRLDAIQECHHVAGEGDYVLKVRCRSLRELESLISVTLKGLRGVIKTQTTIVLSTVKETAVLPLTIKGTTD